MCVLFFGFFSRPENPLRVSLASIRQLQSVALVYMEIKAHGNCEGSTLDDQILLDATRANMSGTA